MNFMVMASSTPVPTLALANIAVVDGRASAYAVPRKSNKLSVILTLSSMGICGGIAIGVLITILAGNAVASEIIAVLGNVPINGTDTYCYIENSISFSYVTWLKVNGGVTLGMVIYLILAINVSICNKDCGEACGACGGCLFVFYWLFKIAWVITGWILWAQTVNRHCGYIGDINLLVDGGLGVNIVSSMGFLL